MGIADKYTVTLWPPEHGREPHIPIEVQPGAVEGMKKNGWRDTNPNSEPKAIVNDRAVSAEPTGARNKKKKSSPSKIEPSAEDKKKTITE